jgi:prevent-host-death family protein
MIHTNVTDMRKNIFELLEKVSCGEVIIIERRGKTIAKIVPAYQSDWRKKLKVQAELLEKPDQAFEPIKEIWEDYL